MKILNLANTFLPDNTGLSIRAYNLLSRLPYNIIYLAPNRTLDDGVIIDKNFDEYGNILVKRVDLDRNIIWNIAPFRFFKETQLNKKAFLNIALNEDFDIVHGHNMSFYGHYALEISKKMNKPFIFEIHVADKMSDVGLIPNIYELYLLKISKIFDSCEYVLVLTDSLKKLICLNYNLNDELVKVIPNGVDKNMFKPEKSRNEELEDLKSSLNIENNIIMYAGLIDELNGVSDILEIIPSIIKEKSDISFIFIGTGPLKEEIISLSNKYQQVKYIPTVENEKMPLYYQLCDIFLIPRPSSPSAETIIPLKLLEAMAMERTVLGSNVGGISEVIKHGKNGYLFEKGDMNDFKNKLLEILATKNNKISKNARKTIINDYTWEKSSQILEKLYEGIIY
jgi:glycosyltransferase involved in cell wall biosynthesis